MSIHVTFYKHISNTSNKDNAQQNYLSIEPLLNLLVAFFVEKTKFLSNFFSNSEFGMRVYKGKIKARSESIPLYTFLRISQREINVLKRTKLHMIELNKVCDINVKKRCSIQRIFWNLLQKC